VTVLVDAVRQCSHLALQSYKHECGPHKSCSSIQCRSFCCLKRLQAEQGYCSIPFVKLKTNNCSLHSQNFANFIWQLLSNIAVPPFPAAAGIILQFTFFKHNAFGILLVLFTLKSCAQSCSSCCSNVVVGRRKLLPCYPAGLAVA
jgi:hypothetical protein